MDRTPLETEPFEFRAQRAIYNSQLLIRQSFALRAQTRALLDKFEKNADLEGRMGLQSQPNFLQGNHHSLLTWTVDASISITSADMGNVQLFDAGSGALHIAAQHGFRAPFLDYFGSVHEGEAACGLALKNGDRVIVDDVTESPIFQGTRALEVLLDAGVRAVQSTPLIGSSGALLGVLSTHWCSPSHPGNRDLLELDLLARTVSNCLESLYFS